MAKRSEDFRDWDIEPETSESGTDAYGYPYFVWRESADNRLMLSRPRYCCITEQSDGLYFTFFDPSQNQRRTWAAWAFWCMALLVAVIVVLAGQTQTARGPYVSDLSAPPFMVFIATLFYGSAFGALFSGIWYAVVIMWRWISGRFPGEGQITMMPWTSLHSFERISAGDAGVMVNDKRATSGYCLAAVFSGRTPIILNNTAWDYKSIAADHDLMTRIFIDERSRYIERASTSRTSPRQTPAAGIPKSTWD